MSYHAMSELPRVRRGSGGKLLLPTRQHRPAIWECMLGTVYASDPSGRVKYFDYDYDGAKAWAGIGPDSDVRRGVYASGLGGGPELRGEPSQHPRMGQNIWWVA